MQNPNAPLLSNMSETMLGSEIIKLAWSVNEKIAAGEKINNLTIGDYDPNIFPIPEKFKEEIIKAYQNNITNYPPSEGILPLRNAVSKFLKTRGNLDYKNSEILITGGSRPSIFGVFGVLTDPGDKILFPIPSWNNNHYTHLFRCEEIAIPTLPENNFMPTAAELAPHISEAALVCICSPLNPTGTCISGEALAEICDLILAENKIRKEKNVKPLYLMYDQIYWLLNASNLPHVDPVTLRPEMKDFTLFIHGTSKIFAATGVRVGWIFGPEYVIGKLKNYLGHVGSWAPKAEQVAAAALLEDSDAVDNYLVDINKKIKERLDSFYNSFSKMKKDGLPVDVIAPQAAIYLTVQFNIIGKKRSNGSMIEKVADISSFLLDEAKIAIVPFSAFGSEKESNWFRISVGTCKLEELDVISENITKALSSLS